MKSALLKKWWRAFVEAIDPNDLRWSIVSTLKTTLDWKQ
jgi:hypothetical protein